MSDREHLDWLLEKTADTARSYLDLLERCKAATSEDEREDLEGEMMAWLYQLELDAQDTRKEYDAWVDTLPEHEEVSA